PGRVVVQTRNLESPAIGCGARGDYVAMARYLEKDRRSRGYPPFGRLCRVVFEDKDPARGEATAQRWAAELKEELAREGRGEGWSVEGASPAPLALVRGRHRFNLLLKAPVDQSGFEGVLAWLVERSQRESRTEVRIDVDPVSMM